MLPPAPRLRQPLPASAVASAQTAPIILVLTPPPHAVGYHALVRWEEAAAGSVVRSSVARALTLRLEPGAAEGFRLCLTATPPVAYPPTPSSFGAVAEVLAGLYAHLELELAPSGQLRGLLNHAAISQEWDTRLRPTLLQRYADPTDQVTATLVRGLDEQLREPDYLFRSLPLDYLYASLPGSFYAAAYEPGFGYAAPRRFPGFFASAGLRFLETLTLLPAVEPGRVRLRLTGTPDPAPTYLDTLRQAMRNRLPPGTAFPADSLPHTAYHADYTLDHATGLPLDVRLVVHCATAAPAQRPVYSKTYTLTIHQAPATEL